MNGQSLMNQGCGGTLVGDTYVITAAHCTDGMRPNNLFVRLGETSLDTTYESYSKTIGVKKIIQHPAYDSSTFANDISILQLKKKISLKDYPNIKPACLPDKNARFPGDAIVSGWGTVGSGMHLNSWLHEVNVTVFADGNCGAMNSHMTPDMMCAGKMEGGKDACQGDSGGPLVAADPAMQGCMSLIGVVSWGFGCAGQDALGIYAEVSYFTSWLNEQMPDLNTCPSKYSSGSTPSPSPSPSPSTYPTTTTPSPSGTSGPATGSCGNCVFPFMYGSRIHESCTTIDGSSTPWCSTTYDYQGSTETCSESCPGASVASTPQMYVHPSNAVNSCCKYSSTSYKYLFALMIAI